MAIGFRYPSWWTNLGWESVSFLPLGPCPQTPAQHRFEAGTPLTLWLLLPRRSRTGAVQTVVAPTPSSPIDDRHLPVSRHRLSPVSLVPFRLHACQLPVCTMHFALPACLAVLFFADDSLFDGLLVLGKSKFSFFFADASDRSTRIFLVVVGFFLAPSKQGACAYLEVLLLGLFSSKRSAVTHSIPRLAGQHQRPCLVAFSHDLRSTSSLKDAVPRSVSSAAPYLTWPFQTPVVVKQASKYCRLSHV